jgi:hypothetical protein
MDVDHLRADESSGAVGEPELVRGIIEPLTKHSRVARSASTSVNGYSTASPPSNDCVRNLQRGGGLNKGDLVVKHK